METTTVNICTLFLNINILGAKKGQFFDNLCQ